jgi:prepilin-type N-terminal cleavage/methylation domain-containing protein
VHLAHKNLIPPQDPRLAFTLVEVLVATILLGLLAAGSLWALAQANNYASIARLYTGAETAAQSRVDYLLSDSPFNPQNNEFGTANEWTTGTSAPENVTIYTEPGGADGTTHAVIGQRVTTVVNNNIVTNQNLNLYSATVVVTYTYRSKTYRVQLNAMRASDI